MQRVIAGSASIYAEFYHGSRPVIIVDRAKLEMQFESHSKDPIALRINIQHNTILSLPIMNCTIPSMNTYLFPLRYFQKKNQDA